MKIRGNTIGTPTPRPDWNQDNPNRADYIRNKPDITIKGQGRSAKYKFTTPGWKRVLNIIRTSGGIVNFGVAQASPLYMTQAAGIVFSGFVKYGNDTSANNKPVLYQLYNNMFGEDDAMQNPGCITKVRIGYPSPKQTDYNNGTSSGIRNPINCYLDVYVQFDPDALQTGKVEFNLNYSGFADSHNCEPITEETDAIDTGVYGEKLLYHEFKLVDGVDLYLPQIHGEYCSFEDMRTINLDVDRLTVSNIPGYISESMIGGGYGLRLNNKGYVAFDVATEDHIDSAKSNYRVITPTNVKYAVNKYTAELEARVYSMEEEYPTRLDELQMQIAEIKAHIGIGDG